VARPVALVGGCVAALVVIDVAHFGLDGPSWLAWPAFYLAWITPRPHAAGAVRRLRLLKVNTIEEEFYRWDDERRATFRVTRQSRRLLDGLAEDFLLDPLDGGARTRLTWTMAIALRGVPAPPKALLPALVKGNAAAIGGIRKIL